MIGLTALLRSTQIETHFRSANTGPVGFNYTSYDFQSMNAREMSVVQPRVADDVYPMSLTFLHSEPINLEDLRLVIRIESQDILSVPVSLLKAMGTTDDTGEEMTIRFNFHSFLESIPTVRINYNEVRYVLKSNTDIADRRIRAASICVGMKYYGIEYRRAMTHAPRIEKPIQNIKLLHTIVNENLVEVTNFENVFYCKGFVVEGNVDELSEYSLNLTDQIHQTYTRLVIHTIVQRLGANTFYIPFNAEMQFGENGEESFVGSIDFTNLPRSHTKLSMIFRNAAANVKIYAVSLNKFVSVGNNAHLLLDS
jgi:hypothetical protein